MDQKSRVGVTGMTPEDSSRFQLIRRWVDRVIDNERLEQFDDIHIDEIDRLYAERATWPSGAVHCLDIALQVPRVNAEPVTVAVGMSLRSTERPLGFSTTFVGDLHHELDWSPPSLYLFKRGAEPWLQGPGCQELPPEHLSSLAAGKVGFFCEWYDEGDCEYRRTLWLTADSTRM